MKGEQMNPTDDAQEHPNLRHWQRVKEEWANPRRKEDIRQQVEALQRAEVDREVARNKLQAAKLAASQRQGLIAVMAAVLVVGVLAGAAGMWFIKPPVEVVRPAPEPYNWYTEQSYQEDWWNTPGAQSGDNHEEQSLPAASSREASPAPRQDVYRITCYSPGEGFLPTNLVARGETVMYWYEYAKACGLDGICAVSPDTPWYSRVRDEWPPILDVAGFGRYLVVDRTAQRIRRTVDLWVPWHAGIDGPQWRVDKIVREIEWEIEGSIE